MAQEEPARPLWEIGVVGGALSQQAYPGASENVQRGLLLPYAIYRGKFLRIDRGGAGVRAIKTETFEFDIGFSGALGSSSNAIEARRGMPNLGNLAEFGPRIKWNLGDGPGQGRWRLDFPLRGVFDISDRFANKGLAFEPELSFGRRTAGGWGYSASVGAVWGDRRLTDTFYGVAPRYATATRPSYEAKSGLIAWRLSTGMSHALGRDWRVFLFGRVDTVAGAANKASPLVKRETGASLGVGLTYTWLRSETTVED
jgi:outer membrane scaffolding protein for murein synthesis (MipA/OmpV family)